MPGYQITQSFCIDKDILIIQCNTNHLFLFHSPKLKALSITTKLPHTTALHSADQATRKDVPDRAREQSICSMWARMLHGKQTLSYYPGFYLIWCFNSSLIPEAFCNTVESLWATPGCVHDWAVTAETLVEKNLRFPPFHENGVIRENRPPKKGETRLRKGSLCNYHEAKCILIILIPCFHGKSFNSTG